MPDEHIDFLERALVEQVLDPLAGGQLALFVLTIDCPAAAGMESVLTELPQVLDAVFGSHRSS
jgi:hypothetical protein